MDDSPPAHKGHRQATMVMDALNDAYDRVGVGHSRPAIGARTLAANVARVFCAPVTALRAMPGAVGTAVAAAADDLKAKVLYTPGRGHS